MWGYHSPYSFHFSVSHFSVRAVGYSREESSSDLIKRLQDILTVCVGFHLSEDVRYAAFFVNDERAAQDSHTLFAIHILLAPRAVFFHHRMIGVREQRERQRIFFGEFLM